MTDCECGASGRLCRPCALLDAEAEETYTWLCRYRGWPVKDGYARICLIGRLQDEIEGLEVRAAGR